MVAISLSRILPGLCVVSATSALRAAPALPADVAQLVISIAPDWNAPRGKLARFERTIDGWRAVSAVAPVAYGKNGLAWGRGILGAEESGLRKVEGDLRAPAGVFAIGKVYGYAAAPPGGAERAFPYHQVTAADAWIEDPTLPDYNRHVIVDLKNPPSWYRRERMNLDDPAFRWRVEIRHNSDPPQSGAGSAIFLHIRRGNRLTAGCTTLAEDELVDLIRWLRTDAKPHYVLLPWSEYQRLALSWRLPDIATVGPLAPPS
jgi:L,D-peptidoglycan transpeptidase YkuD (ErfK/YbiS/YcfS/YnhG family)